MAKRSKADKQPSDFPRYLMVVNGSPHFLPLLAAGRAYDSGFVRVSIGTHVLNADLTVRPLTPEDEAKIAAAADEYAGNK